MLWASLSAHKYRDALTALRHVAQLAGAADVAERGETAFFLGTVFGYLEGPRAGSVAEDELRKARRKTLSLLGDERKDFEAGEEAFTSNSPISADNSSRASSRREDPIAETRSA